ncbi:MAG: hypothetical protein K6G11_02870, partial [Lachnospiraceae bacterium]|nr:hypothetical protein [Lachnospiraceae bacterium]
KQLNSIKDELDHLIVNKDLLVSNHENAEINKLGNMTITELENYDFKVDEKYVATVKEYDDDIAKAYDNQIKLNKANAQISNGLYITFTVIFLAATILSFIGSVLKTIEDIENSRETEYLTIPKYMVDEVSLTGKNWKGEKIIVENHTAYYEVVKCNRNKGKTEVEENNYRAMKDRNDMIGDIGSQWFSLYAVKDEQGYPILADSLLYQKDVSGLPTGYTTGIHEFGSNTAVNLNKINYLFVDEAPDIKVYFKNDSVSVNEYIVEKLVQEEKSKAEAQDKKTNEKDASVSGSIINEKDSDSARNIAIGVGIGVIVLLAVIVIYRRRKKEPGLPE